MKHLKKMCVMFICSNMLFSYSIMTLAYEGRTDGAGRHHDNKNASGIAA